MTSIDGGSLPFTPMVEPSSSASSAAVPDLMIKVSIALRPSTVAATKLASLAALNATTSLNEPPDANCAVPDAICG